MEAKVILCYENLKQAKAISNAVSPDNISTPKNLFVKTKNIGKRVLTNIKYDGNNLMTFLSTIDDLLSCVTVAEKAFKALEKL